MNKNKKEHTIWSYLALVLICATPLLSLIAWLMYFFDIRSRIFYEIIGISTSAYFYIV